MTMRTPLVPHAGGDAGKLLVAKARNWPTTTRGSPMLKVSSGTHFRLSQRRNAGACACACGCGWERWTPERANTRQRRPPFAPLLTHWSKHSVNP